MSIMKQRKFNSLLNLAPSHLLLRWERGKTNFYWCSRNFPGMDVESWAQQSLWGCTGCLQLSPNDAEISARCCSCKSHFGLHTNCFLIVDILLAMQHKGNAKGVTKFWNGRICHPDRGVSWGSDADRAAPDSLPEASVLPWLCSCWSQPSTQCKDSATATGSSLCLVKDKLIPH